jgi:hypothetical protein
MRLGAKNEGAHNGVDVTIMSASKEGARLQEEFDLEE